MEGVGLGSVLVFSSLLFLTGVAGVLSRKNVLIVLMSIELMLNGVNLAFVGFARQHGQVDGQVFAVFVMAVAAAEAAVGLAIVIAMFRHKEVLTPDAFTSLKW